MKLNGRTKSAMLTARASLYLLLGLAGLTLLPQAPVYPQRELIVQAETSNFVEGAVNSTLDRDSETLEEDGSYFETHTFQGREGEIVAIELTSDQFDAYLILSDAEGNWIAQNDDGGKGKDAQIVFTLPETGTYTIIVNTYEAGETGSYQLNWREGTREELELAKADELNSEVLNLLEQGKYQEAEPLAEQALAIRQRILGEEHPDVAQSLNNLAVLYESQGVRFVQSKHTLVVMGTTGFWGVID